MQNTIRYYYNFDDAHISKSNGKNYVKYNNQIYTFDEVKNKEAVIEAYNLTNNYQEYEHIILNKDNSIFTPYANKMYVLIEKKPPSREFPIFRGVPSNMNYLLDRTNWALLWERKVDYFEYQIDKIKGVYKNIDESIDYFIGMAENAISYVNYNIKDDQVVKTISHRRMVDNEYYNPLNIVIDNRMRDVGEYLKMLFWTNNYTKEKTLGILNGIKANDNDYKLLYARLLYPSYYFDAYERVVNKKEDEIIIKNIIKRIDEYEKYILDIYSILKEKDKNLIKIDWI